MRSTLMAFIAACIAVPALAQAPAAKPADAPSINVGVTVFSNYTYTASPESRDADGNDYNASAFDVNRAYINVTGQASRFSFRVTPDITREGGTGSTLNGSLVFRLKYALVQAKLSKSIWVRLGIQQTPYVDYTEQIYRYRFQGPVFADREGYLSSSDAGLSVHADLPKGYGDVHVGLYNGESYSKPESNNRKALMMRGSIRPLPRSPVLKGLRASVFYDSDSYYRAAERTRLIGQVTYEHARATVGAELLNARDQISATRPSVQGKGYSLWAVPKFGHGIEALLRYDHARPNTESALTRNRSIFGVAYWFPTPGKTSIAVLADYERSRSTSQEVQEKVALHTVVNF